MGVVLIRRRGEKGTNRRAEIPGRSRVWEGLEGGRSPDARGWSMGCGRSRHRSPSLQPDGMHKDKTTDNRDGREGKRGGKKQKQLEKNVAKTASGLSSWHTVSTWSRFFSSSCCCCSLLFVFFLSLSPSLSVSLSLSSS